MHLTYVIAVEIQHGASVFPVPPFVPSVSCTDRRSSLTLWQVAVLSTLRQGLDLDHRRR